MLNQTFFGRRGSHIGSKHQQLDINNQDACIVDTFCSRVTKKRYYYGVLSDGCTGMPMFSRTEVGSNLLTTFLFGEIQKLLRTGASPESIVDGLFQRCAQTINAVTNLIVPPTVHWPYPIDFSGKHAFRNDLDATQRFQVDYFSATIIGFIADNEDIIVFSSGDGIIMVNDQIDIIDQNDEPDYIANSLYKPAKKFESKQYRMEDIDTFGIMTDGMKHLTADPELLTQIFEVVTDPSDLMASLKLQTLLNKVIDDRPEDYEDDYTAVTLQRVGYDPLTSVEAVTETIDETEALAEEEPETETTETTPKKGVKLPWQRTS